MDREKFIIKTQELPDILEGDDRSLAAFFSSTHHPADVIEYLKQVDPKRWPQLLRLVAEPDKRAEIVAELPETDKQKLLLSLEPNEIGELIKHMESDDAADLLGYLPIEAKYRALTGLNAEERRDLQELLSYPEDSAGGIMQIEKAQIGTGETVAGAVKIVRQLVEDDDKVLSVWVVDDKNQLLGSVALVDLLLNKSTTPIESIMETSLVTVNPLVDQEEVATLFKKYDLISLPVVDEQNHLLGRIVIDDVVDVLSEEAEEDALHMGGTSREELQYEKEVLSTALIRLPWLSISLVCSLFSATLLNIFDPLFSGKSYLLYFIPVIMAMAGNVGTQSATIMIRSLATKPQSLMALPAILFKEGRVGLLIGLVYGILAGTIWAFILQKSILVISAIVIISMSSAMMTAAFLGVLAPTLLKRFGFDPAVAAGPFVTTLNDISGILIYMLVASSFMSYLT